MEPRKVSPEEYCRAFETWAQVCIAPLESDTASKREWRQEFAEHWRFISLCIRKSCLLDRLIYVGERLRTVPCPEHQGRWSGIQWGDESCPHCAKNSCGCTTGWLPESVEPVADDAF